ncbi:MAG: hypothetical protein IPL99_15735 [Candidatus Competibacteraceae bacterium]|nr:hypothetical protein [Candidatus Competibacteraceae bacterium]
MAEGWRPWARQLSIADVSTLYQRIWPLLVGASASHAAVWMERVLASLAGEGTITIVNLARKLINLPAIAILALSQVVLAQLADAEERHDSQATDKVLKLGIGWTLMLLWPSTITALVWVSALCGFLFPSLTAEAQGMLIQLVRLLSGGLILVGWNTILARHYYARGDTTTPTQIELVGMAVHIGSAAALFALIGIYSLAIGSLLGVTVTWLWLLWRTPVGRAKPPVATTGDCFGNGCRPCPGFHWIFLPTGFSDISSRGSGYLCLLWRHRLLAAPELAANLSDSKLVGHLLCLSPLMSGSE